YPPSNVPEPSKMKINTKKPDLTRARAILLNLLDAYRIPGYKLTKLEIQKLAYFLQETGEMMRLRYTKEQFGPYADNLNHVLELLEGHYITGFGDRSKNQYSEIYLRPGALQAAQVFLENQPDAIERLDRVRDLIEGYESPYGMELLSTVH